MKKIILLNGVNMKPIIRIALFLTALFISTQIPAQTVANLSTASDTYVIADAQELNNYYQNFNYYNNPEINRLENEVTRHGNLFRRDIYGKNNFKALRYSGLSESEKSDLRNSASSFYRENISVKNKEKDVEKEKTPEQRAEEYFNKMIAPFLNSDGSINKQKLHDEIKKDLNTLFELKETEKQKDVAKMEKDIKALQNILSERKKSKQEIINQKMNELAGLPNTLKW
jgi:hypothetical protein